MTHIHTQHTHFSCRHLSENTINRSLFLFTLHIIWFCLSHFWPKESRALCERQRIHESKRKRTKKKVVNQHRKIVWNVFEIAIGLLIDPIYLSSSPSLSSCSYGSNIKLLFFCPIVVRFFAVSTVAVCYCTNCVILFSSSISPLPSTDYTVLCWGFLYTFSASIVFIIFFFFCYSFIWQHEEREKREKKCIYHIWCIT